MSKHLQSRPLKTVGSALCDLTELLAGQEDVRKD